MKDPFNPKREMLSAAEAAKVRADLDARWAELETGGFYADGGDQKYHELVMDEFFLPFEVSHPFLAEYLRRQA